MFHDGAENLERLLGKEGEGLEAHLATQAREDRLAPRFVAGLRRRWAPELVALALRLQEAKDRQSRKFPADEPLRFTPELLEQASAHPPAAHRAGRLAPLGPVLDLGCGAGADLTRLAAAGGTVTGLEADPLAAGLARANLTALGLAGRVITGRFPEFPLPETRALFVDPARRASGSRGPRHHSSRDFSPPPALLAPVLRKTGAWALKWGPALPLDHGDIAGSHGPLAGFQEAAYELELVSWQGELREAVFWGGAALRGGSRCATVLRGEPGDFVHHSYAGDADLSPRPPASPVDWVHEPDPALIRAGLLDRFAAEHGLAPLAPDIAYFGGPAATSPFLKSWRLIEHLPFSLRGLQTALDRHAAGPLILKKRGFPLDPETLRGRLRCEGERRLTVLIYRDRRYRNSRREHWACLCEAMEGGAKGIHVTSS